MTNLDNVMDNAMQGQATAPAPTASTGVAPAKGNSLINLINSPKMKDQLKNALPSVLTPDRFARVVMTELRRTPALGQCNVESFLGSMMQAAQLGLDPSAILGQCYLLPFGNGKAKDGKPNCQLIIGYKGMLELARRSGQIQSINVCVVNEKDDFHYQLGLNPDIHHIPTTEASPGNLAYVYAVARFKDGGVQFEVMSRAQIEAVRKSSKAGSSGPWNSHYEEMAKKTVIRRLFKYLPISIESLQKAVAIDEAHEVGKSFKYEDDGEVIEVMS